MTENSIMKLHLQTVKELLKCCKTDYFFSDLSIIWGNVYCFYDKYICATALYLLSMLAHVSNIIIDWGVWSPVHSGEVVNGLNDTDKMLISMLIMTVQLPGIA